MSKLPPSTLPRVVVILGATGTGKTFLLRRLLNQYPRVFLFDPTRDNKFDSWAPVTSSFQAAIEPTRRKNFRIRFVHETETALEAVCEAAFHIKNCCIAIDEVHEFVKAHHQGIPHWFRLAVLRGRHEGISIIASSQRPANVHNDLISQAGLTFLFRSEVADLGWLKRYKVLHSAPTLKVGQFLNWPPVAKVGRGGGL